VLAAGAWAGTLGRDPSQVARADMWWWLMLPIAAVLGHMFSPFVGFRGGKGVATGSGAMLAVYPVLTGPVVIAIGLWAVLLAATRYMSVASIAAAAAIPLAVAAIAGLRTGDGTPDGELPLAHAVPALAVTGAVAVLVIAKHRGNIERLIAGTEHRLGSKKR
jgi:glycerol-3-phosphate acyltransferase PlsY